MKSAFLMHPLDAGYVRRSWYCLARIWASILPDRVIEMMIKRIKPYIHSRFKIKNHESMIIICPLTSRQMMELPHDFVVSKIKDACDLAYENGALVISLGAYSAIATNQGKDLVGKTKIGITTGRAYTIYIVMEQAKRYLKVGSKVAIVGGDGAIGNAIAKLAKKYDVVKINKKNILEVYKSDLVICATSSLNNVIDPMLLKKNCVVIDAAKPSDISRKSKRDDLVIIDGGIVKIPCSVDFGIDFDCSPDCTYACMAEAFILGMSERSDYGIVGKEIDLKKVREIGKMGEKLGFKEQ